jgi:hypothetical protein
MSSVTRHALRVYAALAELKGNNVDVLDALVPFFEPILEVMNGKVFDPKLLSAGVARMYNWRFTRDVAEQFIPRLERREYLERRGTAREGTYIVRFAGTPDVPDRGADGIKEILARLIDEFQAFTATLGSPRPFKRSRDQLTEILIRFLVSTDAFGGPTDAKALTQNDFETTE